MSTAVNLYVDATAVWLMKQGLLSSSLDNTGYDIPQCLGL